MSDATWEEERIRQLESALQTAHEEIGALRYVLRKREERIRQLEQREGTR